MICNKCEQKFVCWIKKAKYWNYLLLSIHLYAWWLLTCYKRMHAFEILDPPYLAEFKLAFISRIRKEFWIIIRARNHWRKRKEARPLVTTLLDSLLVHNWLFVPIKYNLPLKLIVFYECLGQEISVVSGSMVIAVFGEKI